MGDKIKKKRVWLGFDLFVLRVSYGRISMVDDLSHEVCEEDGLSNYGEPGEQVTRTQSQ